MTTPCSKACLELPTLRIKAESRTLQVEEVTDSQRNHCLRSSEVSGTAAAAAAAAVFVFGN